MAGRRAGKKTRTGSCCIPLCLLIGFGLDLMVWTLADVLNSTFLSYEKQVKESGVAGACTVSRFSLILNIRWKYLVKAVRCDQTGGRLSPPTYAREKITP